MLKDQTDNLLYYEDIVETIREPLLVLDSDFKILSANRNFYSTFKVNPKKTIGNHIYKIENQQWNIPKLQRLLEEILPKDNPFDNYEVEHVFPDIGHKIMLLNARRITRERTGFELILLTIEDITERKQAEEALKESEEKYRTLSYNIPGMIYRAGTDWSTQVITNLEEVCGYSIDEWYHQKMNWIDLIHPDDKQGVIASGYAKTKEVDLAQELGAGKYIKKPYTLEKIGVAVKKELEK